MSVAESARFVTWLVSTFWREASGGASRLAAPPRASGPDPRAGQMIHFATRGRFAIISRP
jgi:hypothetical protein